MTQIEFDKETKEVLNEGAMMTRLVMSDEWRNAKERLLNKLTEFTSINDLEMDDMTGDEIRYAIQGRKAIQTIILYWISEIEGEAEMHENTRQAFKWIGEGHIVKQHL